MRYVRAVPTLRLADLDLYYEAVGEGPPLVLLHGLGSSGLDWEFQVPHFRDRFRVVTPDLRGHGRSAKPPGPYPIPLLAADGARFLGALELAPAHVFGVSMGGMIGLQLAADEPEAVRSLVAVNTMPEVFVRTLKQRWMLWQRLAIVRLFGMRAWARFLAPRFFPGDEHAELRRAFVERWSTADRYGFLAALRGFLGWSVTERLSEIEAPTLVIAAEHDFTSVESKREWAARMPRAEPVVVPDSRHALPGERPEELNRLVEEFLHRVEGDGHPG